MIIAYEMPEVTSVTVNQGTLTSASAEDLYDGSPGTSVVFTTPGSTGTTLRFTMAFTTPILTAVTGSPAMYLVVKIANVRAASFATPPAVAVTLIGPGTTYSATAVVLEPTGENSSRSILIPFSTFGPGFAPITAIQVDITNQTATSNVSIGEVFVSRAYDICLTKLAETPIDPSITRRSFSNRPRQLFRLPFRRVLASFLQVTYQDGFVNSATWPVPGNLRNLMFGVAVAEKVAIIDRWRYTNTSAANQQMIDTNTMLASLVDMSGFEGEAGKDRWPMTATFEESL